MSLPFFHRHCTILYTVKAKKKIRSHNCWFLPVESAHSAVNITTEERVQFCWQIPVWNHSFKQLSERLIINEQSALGAPALMPLSHLDHNFSAALYSFLWVLAQSGKRIFGKNKQDKHYSEQETVIKFIYVGTKNKHLPECGEMSLLPITEWNHAMPSLSFFL